MTRQERLRSWRMNSPFAQTLLVCLVVFCGPGFNSTVLGLGAGGSRPEMIPTVDKVNILGASITIFVAIFGGSCINQIGPRNTLLIAATGYPLYIGSLWSLDRGNSPGFAYFAAVWHGISAALMYSAAGYVVASYSVEYQRARYIGCLWFSAYLGNTVGSAITLGITASANSKRSHVPPAVYITTIVVQSFALLFASFIKNPDLIRRNDGRPIAIFRSRSWREELAALPRTILTPKILLLAIGITASQFPNSFAGSLNAFYFNARTRALISLCLAVSSASGALLIAFLCDSKMWGGRRHRGVVIGGITGVTVIGVWSGFFWFLTSHRLDRSIRPHSVDWTGGSSFSSPLVLFILLGLTITISQGYLIWLCTTFSNDPPLLSRYNGYIEALRALGLAVAFGIDSNSVPFLTEGGIYFSLLVVGIVLAVVSAGKYTKDSKYGEEESVIVPEAYERKEEITQPSGVTAGDVDYLKGTTVGIVSSDSSS